MAHITRCSACNEQLSIADDVFERRIRGRKVSVRCTRCRTSITIDGSDSLANAMTTLTAGVDPAGESMPSPPPVKALPPPPPLRSLPNLTALLKQPPVIGEPAIPAPTGTTLLGLPRLPQAPAAVDAAPSAPPAPPAPPAPATPEPEVEAAPLPMPSVVATLVMPVAPAPAQVPVALPVPPITAPEIVEPSPAPFAFASESAPASTDGIVSEEPRASGVPRRARVARLVGLSFIAVIGLGVALVAVKKVATDSAAAGPQEASVPSAMGEPKPAAAPAETPVAATAPETAQPVVTPAPAPAPTIDDQVPPAYVPSPQVVLDRTTIAIRQAERCHLDGRARGKADLFVTFGPNGRVTEARLEGEPIASAPVARCIIETVQAVRAPKFEGAPFTLRRKITLR